MLTQEQEKYLIDSINYFIKEYKVNKLIQNRGAPPQGRDIDLENSLLIGIIETYKEVLKDMKDLNGNNTDLEYLQLFKDKKSEKLRFFVWLPVIVEGEEFKGWQNKAISVIFSKNIDISEIDEVGTILIDRKIINLPKYYKIRVINGFKNYPYIFITSYVKYYKNGNIMQPIEKFKNEKIFYHDEIGGESKPSSKKN